MITNIIFGANDWGGPEVCDTLKYVKTGGRSCILPLQNGRSCDMMTWTNERRP